MEGAENAYSGKDLSLRKIVGLERRQSSES